MRFADPLDRAAHTQQLAIDRAIANTKKQERLLKPKGKCHFCLETVDDLKLFCDQDCSSDYDKLIRNKR